MKKSIMWGLLVFNVICTSAFARPGKEISKQVEEAFRKRFVNAELMQWESLDNYTRATFRIDGAVMFAYFNSDGKLAAVTRNILSDQLPIHLLIALNNDYRLYWIVDLFELNSNGETNYFVTLKSAEQELVLESQGGEEWEIFRKENEE
jgi:hypothetical protein